MIITYACAYCGNEDTRKHKIFDCERICKEEHQKKCTHEYAYLCHCDEPIIEITRECIREQCRRAEVRRINTLEGKVAELLWGVSYNINNTAEED